MSKTKKSIRAGVYNTLCEQAERAVGAGAKNSSLVTVLLFAVPLFALGILLFALPQRIFPKRKTAHWKLCAPPPASSNLPTGAFRFHLLRFARINFPRATA